MPEIGNPNVARNPFRGIEKYNGPDRGQAVNPKTLRRQDRNVGEVLLIGQSLFYQKNHLHIVKPNFISF